MDGPGNALRNAGAPILDLDVNRVGHHDRGFGRVEDDDGFAPIGAAHLLQRLGGGLSELVDIAAGAGAGAFGGNGGDDLGISGSRHPGYGIHNRDGGLTAAGYHVDIHLVFNPLEIDAGY